MDFISSILDGLDNVGKLVPDLESLLSSIQLWVSVFLLIGPLCMLALGIIYLFLPPKEANHRIGYRTYFGMGSIDAWKQTQKIAGIVYIALGLLLSAVMGIICLTLGNKEGLQIGATALVCLCIQIVAVLLVYLGMFAYTAIAFDKDGNRRKDKKNAA